MNIIYKYHLPIQDEVVLEVPGLFRPLHVGEQGGRLYLWALVDPADPTGPQRRVMRIYGTGHRVDSADEFNYIGTVETALGLVWHVADGGTLHD